MITCALLLFQVSHAQVHAATKQVFSPDFKWKLTIPDGFEPLSAEQIAQLQQNGKEAMEKSIDKKIENHTTSICAFKNGLANYFEANQQPFDKKIDGDYLASCKAVDEVLYKTFKEQVAPGTQIDTTYSKETIDGLEFERFEMKVNLGATAKLNMLMYNRLFGDKEFTASIVYIEKEMGDLILTAWRKSKFAKN